MELPDRDNEGNFPQYAWPGGYPIYYLTKDSLVVCPSCASREVDQSSEVIACDLNWEDSDLHCDDCGNLIESAYGEGD